MDFTALFKDLPDFSGVLLAAIGVAMILAPEVIKALDKYRKWRIAIASVVVLLGVGGLFSGHFQRKDADTGQAELRRQITTLEDELKKLHDQGADTNKAVHESRNITLEQKTDPALLKILQQRVNDNLDTLKIRTLLLADKLEVFAEQRKQLAPGFTETAATTQEEKTAHFRQQNNFYKDTLDMYHTDYEDETVRIFNELKARGLDSRLEVHSYNLPADVIPSGTNPKQIADELRKLAKQLDNNGKVIR